MADVVVAKYIADVKAYIKEIEKATGKAQKDFQKTNKEADKLTEVINNLGKKIAGAFAVERIIAFTAEASKLAAEGEGVRKAFERIGDPQLLQGLRDATKGTVSDLNLMKNAVRASNFKIPLQDLAKLFEFARRRAKETGEEVDYLVNSIVLGIGRKSPLILDNLGISAVELRKKLKGVGVEAASVGDISKIIGEIATEEMQKMGAEVDSTKDSMDQLTASTDNLKEALGTIANEVVGPLAKGLTSITQSIANELTEIDRFRSGLANATTGEIDNAISEQKRILDELETDLTRRIGRISDAQAARDQGQINDVREKIELAEALRLQREQSIPIDELTIGLIDKATKSTEEQNLEVAEAIKNAAHWSRIVKALQKEQLAENTTLERQAAIIPELSHAMTELNRLLGKAAKSSKAFNDTVDEEAKHNVEGMTGKVNDLVDALNLANEGFDAAAAVDFENQKQMDATDEFLKKQKESADGTAETWEQAFGQATQIADQFYDMNRRREEAQMNYQMELLNQQLEAGVISQEEYDAQLKGIQQERASAAKQSAMFNAVLNTAQAVTSALSVYDYASAILFGVLGAAEIGTIASQPIPQFAKGTKEAPAGLKWVGEEGPELIYDQGGYPIITHKESMKILEKYNIPTVNFEKVETGGWGGLADSTRLQNFNDRNILVAIDRHRTTDKEGFKYIAKELGKAMKVKRRGYA